MWLIEIYAACPFATHLGFSCILWHQGAAAVADYSVIFKTQEDK